MAIAIKPKRSESSSSAPTASDLAVGEIAVNSADQKIYTKNSGGSVVVVGNANLADDSSPQLGGTLSTNGNQIQLSQTSGVAIRTSGDLSTADLTLLRASALTDGTYGFDIKYMGSRTGNANSFALEMHNQQGTNVEAITVYQDGKVGINNTAPSSVLDVGGNTSITGDLTITDSATDSSAGPELSLVRDSSSPADADYLGQIKFMGDDDGGSQHVYAKITGKIQDASAGTEDGLIEFANVKAGSNTITARLRSDSLQLLNGTGLTVAGNTTLTGSLTASGLSYPTSDGTANQVLATDGSGTLSFVDGGGSASGENVSWSVTQSSHGFSAGDVIYNNGTSYAKAQANSASTLGLFVVSAVADANNFTATLSGKITLSSLTAGQYYFLSSSTAGLLTTTEPTSGYSNPILFALTTTQAVVLPFRPAQIDTTLTTIAVADGGTGATTAAGARTNLDVYSTAEVNAQSLVFSMVMG